MGQAVIFSSARKPSACTAAVSSLVVVIIAGKHRAVQHPSLTFSPMRPEPE